MQFARSMRTAPRDIFHSFEHTQKDIVACEFFISRAQQRRKQEGTTKKGPDNRVQVQTARTEGPLAIYKGAVANYTRFAPYSLRLFCRYSHPR